VTYALLIYRMLPASVPIPEADETAALVRHRALQAETSARGELRSVARLDDTSTARSLRPLAGAHELSDGPFVETKEWLVGFYVVDCANEQEAIERARLLCPDASHGIEVRPVTWQWNR
jgi:hypothetical protein